MIDCGYHTPCGWNAIAQNRVSGHRLEHDLATRFLVIGAGYAGLAIARRLAELHADETVVLIDALPPAQNSSGRNSGFMINLPFAKIRADASEAQSQWQTRLLSMGRQRLANTVQQHAIQCGWQDTGHYKAATTDYGVAQLGRLQQTLACRQIDYRTLSGDQIQRELGTRYYKAAIWLKQCTLVQPAELVNGLVASLPANVQAYFGVTVTGINGDSPYQVQAGAATIRADHVFLAVNTLLPEFGYARYRQLSMYTYAGLSDPLAGPSQGLLGEPPQWGVTPVEQLEATSRKTADNRLLLRAGFSYKSELNPEQVARLLQMKLQARYPDAPPDLFRHIWGGAVSLTRNGEAIMGRLDHNLYGVSGCNASGILKMTALGYLLADLASGKDSALLQETQRHCRPSLIPPEPIRTIAVNLNLRRLKKQLQPHFGK